MAYEPKILLTLYKEGGTLVRQEPEVREFVLTKKDLSPNQTWRKKEEGNKIARKGKYTIYPLKQKEVTQRITMCVEAYEYMTSAECPEWFKCKDRIKEWRKLSPEERLNFHLARTCQHFGANRFSYTIIED